MERAVSGVATGQNGSADRAETNGPQESKSSDEDHTDFRSVNPSSSPSGAPKRRCPACQGDNVHRSRRRFWQRYITGMFHAGERLFRCHGCRHRFWAPVVVPLTLLQSPVALEKSRVVYSSRNRRRRSSHEPPLLQKLQNWLYRKYGLSFQTLSVIFILFSIVLYFLYWAIGEL